MLLNIIIIFIKLKLYFIKYNFRSSMISVYYNLIENNKEETINKLAFYIYLLL